MQRAYWQNLVLGVVGLAGLVMCMGRSVAMAQDAKPVTQVKSGKVTAEIMADRAAVTPGSTLHVAVRLQMEPGWHVYWLNPGDTGYATTAEFTFDGGTLGSVHWPVPIQFEQPGEMVGYGYENEVVIVAVGYVGRDAAPGSQVMVRAKVRWLSCKDVCVPGEAELSLTVPVISEAAAGRREMDAYPPGKLVIDPWMKAMPRRAGDARGPVTGVRVEAVAGSDRRQIVIDHAPVAGVEFFPGAGKSVELREVELTRMTDRTVVGYRAQVYDRQMPDEVVRSMLIFRDADGQRRGVWIELRSADVVGGP
jgi:DsbC/DsbD-like thiol-disulfide interchange protein